MECFDKEGFNSFLYVSPPNSGPLLDHFADEDSPVVELHVGKNDKGQPVPIITPNDVAKGIAYLASDEARMVNGASLPIDAAWSTL